MRQNELDRRRLDRHMKKFLAGGGCITRVPSGVSGEVIAGTLPKSERVKRVKRRTMLARLDKQGGSK